jgi:hypothetical protein
MPSAGIGGKSLPRVGGRHQVGHYTATKGKSDEKKSANPNIIGFADYYFQLR